MEALSPTELVLLAGGGLVAGVANVIAGGGSLLTVPLLVLLGVPGTLANGTNRVGVLVQCVTAARRFRVEGVLEPRAVGPVLVPVVLGSVLGAYGASLLADRTFERIFGVMMLVMLIPTLRHVTAPPSSSTPGDGWHPAVAAPIYFVLGLYSGALQAGVGLPLLFALVHAGHDVVRANAIKVAVIAGAALAAVPVFALRGQVAWAPALALALGFSVGGLLGARLVVREGEKVVRPVLVIAVIALAARMLGLY